MNLDAKNVSNFPVCLSKLKYEVVFHVSVFFTIIQNEWLATNSRNAILNNFEEYYICNTVVRMDYMNLKCKIKSKSKDKSDTISGIIKDEP